MDEGEDPPWLMIVIGRSVVGRSGMTFPSACGSVFRALTYVWL